MAKKLPSPCMNVCKYKLKGHCIACSMTKPQKSLFKQLKKFVSMMTKIVFGFVLMLLEKRVVMLDTDHVFTEVSHLVKTSIQIKK